MTTKVVTASQDEVPVRCAIWSWLCITGALGMAVVAGFVGWDCWLTLRSQDTDKVAAVASTKADGLEKQLDEIKADLKELLRRSSK